MPYIPKDSRAEYDDEIDSLIQKLRDWDNDILSSHLTYVFFRLAAIIGAGEPYARMAVVRSALHEAYDEFRRRFMNEYEDEKIKQNGDVEL